MHLHHCLRDWEGRGPVIVLGNLNIERDFPERTYNKMLGTTPPWTTHESRFMRIAYHLQYRAQRLGWDIEPNEVCNPERFGMSKATQYALALEEEAKTLLAVP